eukprot:167411-Chlamydomonas_euryale.AAC.1
MSAESAVAAVAASVDPSSVAAAATAPETPPAEAAVVRRLLAAVGGARAATPSACPSASERGGEASCAPGRGVEPGGVDEMDVSPMPALPPPRAREHASIEYSPMALLQASPGCEFTAAPAAPPTTRAAVPPPQSVPAATADVGAGAGSIAFASQQQQQRRQQLRPQGQQQAPAGVALPFATHRPMDAASTARAVALSAHRLRAAAEKQHAPSATAALRELAALPACGESGAGADAVR